MRIWARLTGRDEEERPMESEAPGVQPEPTWRTTDPDHPTERHETPWAGRPDYEQAKRTISDAHGNPEPVASGAHGEGAPEPVKARAEGWPDGPGRLTVAVPESVNPIVDSGVHVIPPERDTAERCNHCGGRVPTDHELLTDLLELLSPEGPEAMRRFYARLFEVAPDLRELFPARIEVQEEKLLAAIVALLKLFQAGDEEMEQLDAALARFGRSHTRFEPAATIEEYSAVWTVLAEILIVMLGPKLTERHVKALRRAYEYAAGKMLAAQATAKFTGTGRRRRTV